PPNLFRGLWRNLRRHVVLGCLVEVFRVEIVELVIAADPYLGDDGHLRRVAGQRLQHPTLELASDNAGLDEDFRVPLAGRFDRGRKLLGTPYLANANTGARPGGLDECGIAEPGYPVRHAGLVQLPLPRPDDDVVDHRQTGRDEELLHVLLVHRHRARQDAGPDIGHAGELEQPLQRAILAIGAVQQWEDDVDFAERAGTSP